jgi:hypothetical protein
MRTLYEFSSANATPPKAEINLPCQRQSRSWVLLPEYTAQNSLVLSCASLLTVFVSNTINKFSINEITLSSMSQPEGPEPRIRKAPKPFEGNELLSSKKTSSKSASKKAKSSRTQPKSSAIVRVSIKKRVSTPVKPKAKRVKPKCKAIEGLDDGRQQSEEVNDVSEKEKGTLICFYLHF